MFINERSYKQQNSLTYTATEDKMAMKALLFLALVFVVANAKVLKYKPQRVGSVQSGSPDWCKGLDCPAFEVVSKTDAYEERRYSASSWVSTNMINIDHRNASSKMFMKLFGYIQGQNTKQEKIDMTVPVRTRIVPGQGPACEDNFTMSFFISPKVADPPQPNDKTVFLSELPDGFTVYVSQFGGYYWKISDWIEKALELVAALEKDGVSFEKSYYYINGYDSPWTLINRHNEIWFIKK